MVLAQPAAANLFLSAKSLIARLSTTIKITITILTQYAEDDSFHTRFRSDTPAEHAQYQGVEYRKKIPSLRSDLFGAFYTPM